MITSKYLKFKSKKVEISTFILILVLSPTVCTEIICTKADIDTISSSIFTSGDYLVYDVGIASFLPKDSSEILFLDPDDTTRFIHINGQLRFDVIEVNADYTTIDASFLLKTSEEHGDIDFYDQISFSLRDNKIYFNDTLWGYWPFIFPQATEDELVFSGLIEQPDSLVKEAERRQTAGSPSYGYQECVTIKSEIYSYYTSNNQTYNERSTYTYDLSVGLAYSISTKDPFWLIFPREFVITRGSSTTLKESNIDFGSPNNLVQIVELFYFLLLGPGLIITAGFLIFVTFFSYRRINHRKHRTINRKRQKSRSRKR